MRALLCALLATAVAARPAGADDGPWPAFHANAQHTGLGVARGPRHLSLAWYVATTGDVDGSPVVAADGSVYVASVDGSIYGLSREGGRRWVYAAGASVGGSPVLTGDARLVFGDSGGRVTALNTADGTVAWTRGGYGSVRSTPVVAAGGTILFGTDAGDLVALTSSGEERFRVAGALDVLGAPAISARGDAYYWGSVDRRLRRASAAGELQWAVELDGPIVSAPAGGAVELDGPIVSAPAVGAGDVVYAGAGSSVLAVDGASGAVRWRFGAGSPVVGSPALGPDGTVYFGAADGRFFAVSSSGQERWQVQTGGAIRSSAAVDADGVVYFGSGDGIAYAYGADGGRLSTFRALDAVHGSPALDAAGSVYIGSRDNRLYALREDVRRFAQSGPDRLGGDLLRDPATGRVFVLVDGRRRHIPDAATQLLLGLAGAVPVNATAIELGAYPEAAPLPAIGEGTLLRQSNGPVYAVREGRRVWIPTLQEFAAGGYGWDAVATADDLTVRSVALAVQPGMLVRGAGDRVYLVEGGHRRWVTSEHAFVARGFTWSAVHFVSDQALLALPEGPPLE